MSAECVDSQRCRNAAALSDSPITHVIIYEIRHGAKHGVLSRLVKKLIVSLITKEQTTNEHEFARIREPSVLPFLRVKKINAEHPRKYVPTFPPLYFPTLIMASLAYMLLDGAWVTFYGLARGKLFPELRFSDSFSLS